MKYVQYIFQSSLHKYLLHALVALQSCLLGGFLLSIEKQSQGLENDRISTDRLIENGRDSIRFAQIFMPNHAEQGGANVSLT